MGGRGSKQPRPRKLGKTQFYRVDPVGPQVGEVVTVLDTYLNESKTYVTAWRKAKIIERHPDLSVRIHYVGWSKRYDEDIPWSAMSKRIKRAFDQLPPRVSHCGPNKKEEIRVASSVIS